MPPRLNQGTSVQQRWEGPTWEPSVEPSLQGGGCEGSISHSGKNGVRRRALACAVGCPWNEVPEGLKVAVVRSGQDYHRAPRVLPDDLQRVSELRRGCLAPRHKDRSEWKVGTISLDLNEAVLEFRIDRLHGPGRLGLYDK